MEKIVQLLKEIDIAVDSGDWESAKNLSIQILSLEPNNIDATSSLKMAERRLKADVTFHTQ